MLTRAEAREADLGSALTVRRVEAIAVALPLKRPMKLASTSIARVENLVVRIEARDGTVGWGEAASAPHMTGETIGGMVVAVRDHLALLVEGSDARMRPALVERMRETLPGNAGARSAIEMALLDLVGRTRGLPAVEFLGGAMRDAVSPMWLLGTGDAAADIAEAEARRRDGYGFFKLKVGTRPVETEIDTALAVRGALGPDVRLCADANTGFTPRDARRYATETGEANLLFLEQPLPYADIRAMAALARVSPTPIGADEGIGTLADIEAHAASGAAAGVSLKMIKFGGAAAVQRAAEFCMRLRMSVNLASKIAESSIASAATAQLALALPSVDWGVSLTNVYLADDLTSDPLRLEEGRLAALGRPGLGIEVDEAKVRRFALG